MPSASRYPLSATGINSREMLDADLRYAESFVPMTAAEQESLYRNAPELGNYVCRLCNKCLPCPEGIDIPALFKLEGYFDRQMADGIIADIADFALKERLRFWFGNKGMAMERYQETPVKADQCTACGACVSALSLWPGHHPQAGHRRL